ncbi:MAG TPA: plasmid pRiA4b ORF-3 family protein, partial [Ktedonobacterales bacterium]|nr:plasmid pRiA4b ORF-3 family protein [Ktedonobacterales bacterium]
SGSFMATRRASARPETTTIYQLKITLQDSKPPIWRRIQTPGAITLAELHRIIQAAMGWEDQHLHQFIVGDRVYGPAIPGLDEAGIDARDERRARLNEVAPREGSKFIYRYDFGDDWDHMVVVERILEPKPDARYPRCLAGRRACPPEDSGGIWGYEQLMETLKNPSDPEYAEAREWVGEDFNPEAFSLDEANTDLATLSGSAISQP